MLMRLKMSNDLDFIAKAWKRYTLQLCPLYWKSPHKPDYQYQISDRSSSSKNVKKFKYQTVCKDKISPFRPNIWVYWKVHQLNVVPVDFLLLIFLIDFSFYCRTGKEDVESHLVSGRHLVTVSKPHLVVVRVEGLHSKLRSVVKDGVDIVVGGQPRYFRLVMSAVSKVPQSEISEFEAFLSVNCWINCDVRVSVRSVHLMERPHGVEDLVLNSPDNLLLRHRSETGSAQGDRLDPSHSPILAVTQVSRGSSVIFGGETGEK